RYRLAVQLPEGVTPNFQVSDNLPNGISFVNDGTAKVAFVSNGSGISSAAAQTGAIPAVPCVNDTGNAATLAALPQSQVDCALVDANISTSATLNTDTYSTGTDVRFKLGTLTNADSDSDAEYVVIDFNAVLDNTVTGSNDAGDTRSNTFSVYQNATTQNGATSAGFVVKVVEPSIPFSATTNNKTVTPTSGDAGDVVAYTVVYANANGTNNTDAFDVRLLDVVPADAILNLASINVTATAACASPTFTNNSVGNTVDITVSRVAPGCQMTVKYQATLSTAVTPGELITNTANLTYSSLPGAHGSAGNSTGSVAPGAPGTNTGERDGSGSAPNDLFGSDTAVVTVFAPMSVKSLVSTSEAHTAGTSVVIGEIARFRMAVQIAEGSSPGFALRDNLPAGLLFLNDGTAKLALVSTNPGLSSSTLSGVGLQVSGNETTLNGITPTFVLPASAISGGTGSGGAFQSGDVPLFSLGNLSNTDSDTNQEFVVLEFNALVENSASNQNSTTLNNTFTVRLNGVDALTSNTQSVGVVEPNVTMTKQILSTTGATITYRVVATNTGNATAFDTVVADTLPPSLDLNVGSITVNAAGGATKGIANHSDSANRVEFDGITLPAGGSVTITYQANIVTPGTTIANTATTSYSSLPGGGTLGNPTGSNTPGAGGASNGERNGAGGTNDYSATATQSLGSVGDRVWYDVNADGLVNADEVGIPGVAVTVRWFGPDGIEGNGDDSVIAATTDSAGNYLVSGLPLGAGANNYRVTVDLATLPNGLTTATYDFDSGTASPNSNTLLALSGANANPRTADFGYRGTATLGDRIWIDSNGDGAQGLARLEPGLPGAGVTLTWLGFDGVPGGSDDVAFTTTTGANGSYGFANLPAGNFRADVNSATLPDNLVPSYDLNGAADGSATRTLALGASATDVDFGYRGAASIGDTVWYDVNANGVQDNAEPGIPGATVTLRWAGPDGVLGTADDLVYTTTTDVNGTYLFPGLPVYGVSDPYQVTVTPPAAYTAPTYDSDGISSANQSTLTLGASEANSAQDFGYRAAVAQGLGDVVWEDLNGNGRQDNGEPGIDGVIVALYDSTGTQLLATTTTAGGGLYSFSGLTVGNYQVKFGTLPGYARTIANAPVASDSTDSDADATTGFTSQVAVTTGALNTTVDAGLYRPLTIGDTVWYDRDGNGVQNAGEPGIGGATVTVTWYGPDGVPGGGDDQSFTATTDSNGTWSIANLPPGNYGAAVTTLPTGLTTQTAGPATFTLVSGTNRNDIDFGYRGGGSLGDYVWLDTNGDGVQDASEAGIGGATVTLTWFGNDGVVGGSDDVVITTTTAADGTYSFNNLPAGAFIVAVSGLPAGVQPTFDLDGVSSANSATLNLNAGQARTDVDFGYRGTGSLGNFVWLDQNGDGVQDSGEPGIAAVTINLTWAGLDHTFGTTDDITQTTTTDTAGAYLFTGLPAGEYRVSVDGTSLPAGLYATYDLDGTANSTTDTSLSAGQARADVDFGYRGSGTIGDRVWFDTNGDGVQDAGEPGLGGVSITVTWYGPDGVVGGGDDASFTTTTAADGSYQVAGLPAGTYVVTVDSSTAPAGTSLTTAGSVPVTLSAGEQYRTADFGFGGSGSLGDRVWLDLNGNGAQDAGEPGIIGTTVTLVWYGTDGVAGGGDDITFVTQTGADGTYGFAKLPAGNFQVTVSNLPTGVNQTYDLDGTASANTTAVALTPGQTRSDADFGYTGSGSIGDLVWLDANGNGAQDAGEPGLNGVDVTITWAGLDGVFGTADDLALIATTDANGAYSVGGLPAGSYTVDVDQTDAPAGTILTTGNDPLALTLAAGQAYTTADFGFKGTTSLGDWVWNDLNGDGLQQSGEPGIAGVTVTATWLGSDGVVGGGDDVVYTATTDMNGYYRIIELPAGNYTVAVSGAALSGLMPSYDLDGIATPGETATSLSIGQNRVDVDFGYFFPEPPQASTIGDRVWNDTNGNGVQDAGEPGLIGVTVRLIGPGADGLFGTADDAISTVVTGANGDYLFTDLPAGTYRVQIDASTIPAGLAETYELDGSLNGTVELSIGASETRSDVDFGYQSAAAGGTTGSIGDRVWNDANGNGVQDVGEPGIAGVDVTLTGAGADGQFGTADDIVLTTVTGAAGDYSFTGLAAGAYRVEVDGRPLLGLAETYELDGSLNRSTIVALASGQERSDVDFGFTSGAVTPATGSIGDRLWLDLNGDGVQDTGEPGLSGVAVTLTWFGPDGVAGGGDDVHYTQLTGADGSYNFPNLPAGSYAVTIDITTLPPGVAASYDLDGGSDS
ncbi:MAG: DUF11 domain-containing protein, partial [Chloroflexi bacterium SZAS-1]|nr:DUF11 domain-containing protein [Chloroflexi bacterium SZAS-1]